MYDMLTKTYYGNTVKEWLIAGAIILGAAIAGKIAYFILSRIVKRATAKTKTRIDDLIIDMVEEPLAVVVTVVGAWYALGTLNLSDRVRGLLDNGVQIVVVLLGAWLVTRLFDALFKEYLIPIAEKSETDLDDQLLPIVRRGTKVAVWAMAIIMALNNAGYNVGAALAGLGIGGLALAMASKDTVANMFGGLTIFMDGPFKLNDRVRISGFDGKIIEIGLRSTRLETLEGRVVTIPNAEFSENPVENVSAEPSRKVVSTLGLVYDTTPDQMKDALATLKQIADDHEGTEEKVLVAFTEFADSSMNLLFIYYISPDADILQTQTDINLAVLETFAEKGLDMAYPTQTIYTQA
ncbi:MAG: mechanosensitive ion channel family protein, partial [Deltaproteobacteria bacterium]|nr:mechanosensitive ion channel family protein [Deltaproteobacteria bacterium]